MGMLVRHIFRMISQLHCSLDSTGTCSLRLAAQDTTAASLRCAAAVGGRALARGSTCYEFVDTEKTWVDARKHCRQKGMQLVHVTGVDLQQWLADSAERLLPTRQGVWLGLNDRQDEGSFVWDSSNGADKKATYFNWMAGEPNDGVIGQDCVYMRRSSGWRWADVGCNLLVTKYSFICVYAQPTPTAGAHFDGEAVLTTSMQTDDSKPTIAVTSSPSQTEDGDEIPSRDTDGVSSSYESTEDASVDTAAAAVRGESEKEGSSPRLEYLAVGGVLLLIVVVVAFVVSRFLFRRRRERRLAWQRDASSAAGLVSSATGKVKEKESSLESADDVKSCLLNVTDLSDSRFTAERRQPPVCSARAPANIYEDVGFACRRAGGPGGLECSTDDIVYAELVEPLP